MSQEYWNLSGAGDGILIDSSKVFTVFPTNADAFIIESFGVADWIALAAFSIILIFIGCLIGTIKRLKWKRSIGMRSSIIGASLGSLVILVTYGLYLVQRAPIPLTGDNSGIAWYAQYGDAFGVVTSFFTAMGTIGLVVTIFLQHRTLQDQKVELKKQGGALDEQRKLIATQTNILDNQRANSFFDTFLSEYRALYKATFNEANEVVTCFNYYHFIEAKQQSISFSNDRLLKLVEDCLPILGKNKEIFIKIISTHEIKLFLFSSILNDNKHPNILKMLTEEFDDEDIVSLMCYAHIDLEFYRKLELHSLSELYILANDLEKLYDREIGLEASNLISKRCFELINEITTQTSVVVENFFFNKINKNYPFEDIFSLEDLIYKKEEINTLIIPHIKSQHVEYENAFNFDIQKINIEEINKKITNHLNEIYI